MTFKKNAIGYRVVEEAGSITFVEYTLCEQSPTEGWAMGYHNKDGGSTIFMCELKNLGDSKREAIMLYMQQKIEEETRAAHMVGLARKKLFEEIL